MRQTALVLAGGALAVVLWLPGASAAPGAGGSGKRCDRLAAALVKRTKHYPEGAQVPEGVSAASTPVCFDFTRDGRGDVAFGILSGGTAGATHWAVFRGVQTSSRRLSRRFRKVAERYSGPKTRVLREGRLLGVQVPIYRREDPNCCPTGGAGRVLYRVRRTRIVRVGSRMLDPREAGQVTAD